MKKIKNGFFITVEGIDGSGKSSVVNFLSSAFSDLQFKVIKTREPGGTLLGTALRNIIIGATAESSENQGANLTQPNPSSSMSPKIIDEKAEFLLFAADRAQHKATLIQPNLEQGAIVISDRGSDSSLAYQGYGKGLDLTMIQEINSWIMGKIKPDVVIYLKIDYQTAIDRVLSRGEKITAFEKKGELFFNKVIDGFNEIFSSKTVAGPTIFEIDATQSAEKVQKEVWEKVLPLIVLKELR